MFFRKIRSLPSSNWSTHYTLFVYRPQLRCGKVMFLHLCVILFTVSVPACTTGHMTRGVSVWGVFVWVGLGPGGSLGGLCPGGSLWGRSVREEDPPYGIERAIRILLECILVIESVDFTKRTRQQIISFFL